MLMWPTNTNYPIWKPINEHHVNKQKKNSQKEFNIFLIIKKRWIPCKQKNHS
jgi:hypothetical protein